jgi:hypothetical protein
MLPRMASLTMSIHESEYSNFRKRQGTGSMITSDNHPSVKDELFRPAYEKISILSGWLNYVTRD